jgi:hypothetical protein
LDPNFEASVLVPPAATIARFRGSGRLKVALFGSPHGLDVPPRLANSWGYASRFSVRPSSTIQNPPGGSSGPFQSTLTPGGSDAAVSISNVGIDRSSQRRPAVLPSGQSVGSAEMIQRNFCHAESSVHVGSAAAATFDPYSAVIFRRTSSLKHVLRYRFSPACLWPMVQPSSGSPSID